MSRIGIEACLLLAVATGCGANQNAAGVATCQVAEDCASDQSCEDGTCVDLGGESCTVNADCPAGQTCESGTCTVAPDALRVGFVETVMRDERGDLVDVTGDAPVHTHAGAAVTLDGTGCPEIHKYAYLTSEAAPPFGSEDAANPIAWRFNVEGAAAIARADYRIRSATAILRDWTATSADAGGTFPVEVFRDGAAGVPELGAIAQQYFIDFRVRDDRDREAMATGCWDHHPIAAPVKLGGLVGDQDADALAKLTLAASSPISRVMGTTPVKTFAARVTNPTAERVVVDLDLPIPTGTYDKLAVVDRVPQKTVNADVFCEVKCPLNSNTCFPETSNDPRCGKTTPSDPVDTPETGDLEPRDWSLRVFDPRTGAIANECTTTGLHARCVLKPRAIGAPAPELVLELSTTGHRELAPAPFGTIGEFTLLGLGYTGLPIDPADTRFRCDKTVSGPSGDGGTLIRCTEFTTFFKLVALDSLRVVFDAPTITVRVATPPASGLPQGEFAAPNDRPDGTVPGASLIWDAGNDDLPGTAH